MQRVVNLGRRKFKVNAWMETHNGLVRKSNQDNAGILFSPDGTIIAMVADGVGGNAGGDVASSLVVDNISRKFKSTLNLSKLNNQKFKKWLLELIKDTNKVLLAKAEVDPKYSLMGTTLTLAAIHNNKIYVINVGDSRTYFLKGNNILQITTDHSLMQKLVEENIMNPDKINSHPAKNAITSSLGPNNEIQIDLFEIGVSKGYLILTSDGVHGQVSDSSIKKVIKRSESIKEAAKNIINLSINAGGIDNATIVLIKLS